MSLQVEDHRAQFKKSVDDGTRLGEELKRTQESLLFLSAWDQEKTELEAEVSGGLAPDRRVCVVLRWRRERIE